MVREMVMVVGVVVSGVEEGRMVVVRGWWQLGNSSGVEGWLLKR